MRHFESVKELKRALIKVIGLDAFRKFDYNVRMQNKQFNSLDAFLSKMVLVDGDASDLFYNAFLWRTAPEGDVYWVRKNANWRTFCSGKYPE